MASKQQLRDIENFDEWRCEFMKDDDDSGEFDDER